MGKSSKLRNDQPAKGPVVAEQLNVRTMTLQAIKYSNDCPQRSRQKMIIILASEKVE